MNLAPLLLWTGTAILAFKLLSKTSKWLTFLVLIILSIILFMEANEAIYKAIAMMLTLLGIARLVGG